MNIVHMSRIENGYIIREEKMLYTFVVSFLI